MATLHRSAHHPRSVIRACIRACICLHLVLSVALALVLFLTPSWRRWSRWRRGPIGANEAPSDESFSLMAKLTGTESKPLTRHIDGVGSGLTRTGMRRVASSCAFKPRIFEGFG